MTSVPPQRGKRTPDPERMRPGEARALKWMQARAYEGITESAFALLVPIGLGYWLDGEFGTRPIGLLVGVALGFAAMMLRLVRWSRAANPAAGEEGGDGRTPEQPDR